MRERPEEVLAGAAIVQWLLQPEETVLGIEDNKPAAIAALREASASLEEAIGDAIDIAVIPTQYPSGGEKQLIEILTGRQVPSGGLPADIGAACINVGTCAAAFRALCRGEPLISRITTLTGGALAQPRNFEALIGTPVRCLLEEAGFDPARGARLVMGGPMMGFTLDTADVPVVKITNCILAPALGELPAPRPAQPCIRCGLCADACPASLLPQQLYWFAEGREYEKLERHNLFDCIECGACSWVCPSDIPLVQYYRAAKAEVSQLRRDQAKAEQSKARFEARQERVEREAAEREAQRAARRRAAAERAKAGADPVQAAIERAQAKQAALAEAANEVDSR